MLARWDWALGLLRVRAKRHAPGPHGGPALRINGVPQHENPPMAEFRLFAAIYLSAARLGKLEFTPQKMLQNRSVPQVCIDRELQCERM